MIFGLQGSKLLVNVANIINDKKNGEDIAAGKKSFLKNLTKGVINTATDTFNAMKDGGFGDEL